MPTPVAPAFLSLALAGQPPPDWADVVLEPIAADGDASADPAAWADTVFSPRSAPPLVVVLLAVRQALVPLLGVRPADTRTVFAVSDVTGSEALIVAHDEHLDFRCGVGVDLDNGLLRVTTAVWFHGWRGRLYFLPVRLLHDPVTRSMMRRAIRRSVRGTMSG